MEPRAWPPELPVLLRDGVTLRIRRAGLVSRALAWALDASILVCGVELVGAVLGGLGRVSTPLERALLVAIGFVAHWAYGTLAEWRWGSTLGKRALGLGVMDATGGRPALRRTLARNLVRILDVLPGLWLVGGASAWWSRAGSRMGDRAASTVVVCLALPSTRFQGVGTRGRRTAPPSRAGGQGTSVGVFLTTDEMLALHRLLSERERLDIGLREALFGQLGRHFTRRFGLSCPAHCTWESVLLAWAETVFSKSEAGLKRARAGHQES